MENNNLPVATPQNTEPNAVQPEIVSQAQAQQTEFLPDMANAASQTGESQPGTAPTPTQTAVNYGYLPTSAPSMPAQPAYNPYQQQPSFVPTLQTNPYQSAVYGSVAVNPNKKSVGKIVSLILGIILTIIGAFLTFGLAVYDIDTFQTYGEVDIIIPAYIVFLIPLIIGIILIVFGCKKNKNPVTVVPQTAVGANYYAASQPTSYVPTASYTQSQTNTTVSAPVSQPQVNTTNFAPVSPQPQVNATDSAPISQPQVNAADSAPVSQPQVNGASSTPIGASSMTYQYAPTVQIEDDSKKVAKKNARRNGIISIVISACMWLLIFVFQYVVIGWVTIIPIVLAVSSLKSYIKSATGWVSMIFSIITAALVIFVYFASL